MNDGHFTMPTYLHIRPEMRELLARWLVENEAQLPDLLSELLDQHLSQLPPLEPEASEPPADPPADSRMLRRRRMELHRLRERLGNSDGPPDPWVTQYLADMEREIERLAKE